jgi:hypothetical protein
MEVSRHCVSVGQAFFVSETIASTYCRDKQRHDLSITEAEHLLTGPAESVQDF